MGQLFRTSPPHAGQAACPSIRKLPVASRLLEAAKRYALDIADGKRPRLFSLTRSDKLESYGEAVAIIGFVRAQASHTHEPIPPAQKTRCA